MEENNGLRRVSPQELAAATKAIHDDYFKTFGVHPDTATSMVIRVAAPRVARGESFKWWYDCGYRKIVFGGR